MTPINYVIGDATKPQCAGPKIIAHCCNDMGVWGAGFVLALSRRWKQPEAEYRAWARRLDDQPLPLGEVQFVEVEPDIMVANIIGQHDTQFSCGVPPVRYFAITQGMIRIAEYALQRDASVHMPRLGCGLAGGTWGVVENIIRGTLSTADIPATVYDMPA